MSRDARVIAGTVAVATCILLLLQTRQVAQLRAEIGALEHQKAQSLEEIRRLQKEQHDFVDQGALCCDNGNPAAKENSTDILRLRGQVAVLREQLRELQNGAGRVSTVSRIVRLGDRPKLQ